MTGVNMGKMRYATNIAEVTIEAAFNRPDEVADEWVLKNTEGEFFADYFDLYTNGDLPLGGKLEMAVIRRLATFFKK